MQILPLADRPQHLETVARWVWELWRDRSDHSEEKISEEQTRRRLLDPPDCPQTLVAEEDDAPVGVLGFQRFVRAAGESPSLFIDALYVPEPLRGKGIGAALVREGVERARAFAPDLYVYTSYQDWYRWQGWTLLKVDPVSELFVLIHST